MGTATLVWAAFLSDEGPWLFRSTWVCCVSSWCQLPPWPRAQPSDSKVPRTSCGLGVRAGDSRGLPFCRWGGCPLAPAEGPPPPQSGGWFQESHPSCSPLPPPRPLCGRSPPKAGPAETGSGYRAGSGPGWREAGSGERGMLSLSLGWCVAWWPLLGSVHAGSKVWGVGWLSRDRALVWCRGVTMRPVGCSSLALYP